MATREACTECNDPASVQVNDEYTFCHACRHKTSSNSLIKLPTRARILDLPENLNCEWPIDVPNWLAKYDHGIESIGLYCFWSDHYQRLCFPYYIGDDYRGCWMRLVDETTRPEYKSKWLFAGKRDFVWVYFTDRCFPYSVNDETRWYIDNSVVLVEDVVSAIRVSKHMNCICLGGTNLTPLIKKYIVKNYENVILFLDGDSAGRNAAEKIRKELKLDCSIRVIRAKKDPKEFSDLQLKRWLWNY